jgi:Protein of unknown function (DUF2934)
MQTRDPTIEIRLRAQELYEARGREEGHELDDWLRAEAEITHEEGTHHRRLIYAHIQKL